MVPERLGLLAGQSRGEHVEVGVPASADVELHVPIGDAAMGDGEPDHVADRLEVEGDTAGAAPGDSEAARRVELGDLAFQSMLVAELGRLGAAAAAELVIAPDQLDLSADA